MICVLPAIYVGYTVVRSALVAQQDAIDSLTRPMRICVHEYWCIVLLILRLPPDTFFMFGELQHGSLNNIRRGKPKQKRKPMQEVLPPPSVPSS